MSEPGAEPARERPEDDEVLLDSQEHFARAVAPLARGALRFPAPFDVASSVALGRNRMHGDTALDGFNVERRRSTKLRVSIFEVADDGTEREVIDTITIGTDSAAELLQGLVDELTDQEETDAIEG